MTRRGLPAEWGGNRFRSHLEARWAIYFRHLGLAWDYEPQGFVTDGSPYLPDFVVYAALGQLWAEIKPAWDADPEGLDKWRTFAAQRPNPGKSRAVLLVGPPTVGAAHTVIGGAGDAIWEDDGREWRPCPSGHHFDLAWPGTWRTKFAEDGCPDDFGYRGEERIERAVEAALSHRFGKAA